ncbi:MAG: hypothetical protein R2852_04540 [Bacteroidia bacterium]
MNEDILDIPASFGRSVNSSAPISGLDARVSPSISLSKRESELTRPFKSEDLA